jgi:DMSO/TMAO reductase YedYZ molybdopterin-dependent catalytic subunit
LASPERPKQVGPQPTDGPWRLLVIGLVGKELVFDVAAVEALGAMEEVTGGPECPEGFGTSGHTFAGPSLTALIESAEPLPAATHVCVHSGPFVAAFKLESLARRGALLATRRDGEAMSAETGGPVRLVPALGACFDSVKWVERITLEADGSSATARDIVRARRGPNGRLSEEEDN